jgi:hypothetical protein
MILVQKRKPAGSSARSTAGMIANTTSETTHAAEEQAIGNIGKPDVYCSNLAS